MGFALKLINFDSEYLIQKMGYSGFRFLIGIRCNELGLKEAYDRFTTLDTEDSDTSKIFTGLNINPTKDQINEAVEKALIMVTK